jgi:hypothetical protein
MDGVASILHEFFETANAASVDGSLPEKGVASLEEGLRQALGNLLHSHGLIGRRAAQATAASAAAAAPTRATQSRPAPTRTRGQLAAEEAAELDLLEGVIARRLSMTGRAAREVFLEADVHGTGKYVNAELL